MNFFHQGHEIWYDRAMRSYRDCGYGESSSCSDGLNKLDLNTGDHNMDAYITLPGSNMDYIIKSIEVAVEETVEKGLNMFGLINSEDNFEAEPEVTEEKQLTMVTVIE